MSEAEVLRGEANEAPGCFGCDLYRRGLEEIEDLDYADDLRLERLCNMQGEATQADEQIAMLDDVFGRIIESVNLRYADDPAGLEKALKGVLDNYNEGLDEIRQEESRRDRRAVREREVERNIRNRRAIIEPAVEFVESVDCDGPRESRLKKLLGGKSVQICSLRYEPEVRRMRELFRGDDS